MSTLNSNAGILSPGGNNNAVWAQAVQYLNNGIAAVDRDRYNVITHTLYHRKTVTSGAHTPLTFFDVAQSAGVCNIANGTISNDRVFVARTVRVDIIRGLDVAGAAQGSSSSNSSNAVTPNAAAATIEQLMRGGRLTLEVGQRKIIDDVPDLYRFPAGRGIDGYAAAVTTVAATSIGSAVTNNGAPAVGNAYPLVPFLIPGQRQIKATMSWLASLTLSANYVMELSIEGQMVYGAAD